MLKLTHFRLCPLSRSIRLALAEHGHVFNMVEEHAWRWPASFLALNPAGDLPVLELDGGGAICGAYAIVEYLSDMGVAHSGDDGSRRRLTLFPGDAEDRAEVRRLVDWFQRKFDREVSRDLLTEKVYPSIRVPGEARVPVAAPEPNILRAVRANLRHHLGYVSFLADQRRWLAGEEASFADLAAAAHISLVDFLGEVNWDEQPAAKEWYQRIKSRPSFRPLLADRLPGFTPPKHYDDLDF